MILRPNSTALSREAARRYLLQPEAYLQSLRSVNFNTYSEYLRLKSLPGSDAPLKERWEVEKSVYEEFFSNCSNYMMTLLLTDKVIA